jgi:hypothetical protein
MHILILGMMHLLLRITFLEPLVQKVLMEVGGQPMNYNGQIRLV